MCAVACGDDGGGGGGGSSRDDATVVSVKFASCSGQSPEAFAALSLLYMTTQDIDCVVEATSCAATLACMGMRIAGACPAMDTCVDGDTLLRCVNNIGIEYDCAEGLYGGPSCLTTTSGRGKCGTNACTTNAESCDGTQRVTCESGVEQAIDCDRVGLECAMIGTGSECATLTGNSCTDEPSRCEGNDAIGCEQGTERRSPCGELYPGAECFVDGNDAYCGYDTECAFNLTQSTATCDGTHIQFCMLGVSASIDCAAIGFSTCQSDTLSTRCQ